MSRKKADTIDNLVFKESQIEPARLKFKKLSTTAIIPTRGSEYAAGLDLYADTNLVVLPGQRVRVNTGVAVELPVSCYGRIAPRSGLAVKHGIDVLAGVVDSDYRGELQAILINLGKDEFHINAGDRIAQLIVEMCVQMEPIEVEDLDESVRGSEGFGSTGK